MDGPFYRDAIFLHCPGQSNLVTLTAAYQTIAPPISFPLFPANYFGWIGKAIKVRCSGSLTTGATPGSLSFTHYWGNGTNANGVNTGGVSSALTASVSGATLVYEAIVRCRATGVNGALIINGWLMVQNSFIVCCPPFNPQSVVPTVNLATANVLSIQMFRSGSTAETFQMYDQSWEALN